MVTSFEKLNIIEEYNISIDGKRHIVSIARNTYGNNKILSGIDEKKYSVPFIMKVGKLISKKEIEDEEKMIVKLNKNNIFKI